MPETNDPKPETDKPDTGKPDAPKPDETRADGGLARAIDRIKSTQADLARLDRLVSGMEHDSEGKPASRAGAPATAPTPASKALIPTGIPNAGGRNQGLRKDPAMMRALVILVLAIGLLGAAVASQYRDEASSIGKSIMARWAPPAASSAPPQASAEESPKQPPAVLLAAAGDPSPVPAPAAAAPQETESAAKPAAAAPQPSSPDPSSPDLSQSLKAITSELATINGKLEQLKNSNEQTLREQAGTIQQLKAAQEKTAADNARLAAQVQSLQTQLSASAASAAAKPVVRSVMNNDAAPRARPHIPPPEPRRPGPPPRRWMPPPYMGDPYGDPDW